MKKKHIQKQKSFEKKKSKKDKTNRECNDDHKMIDFKNLNRAQKFN